MALQKSKELESGVIADYHRVISTQANWISNSATITVALYLSQDARQLGKAPIRSYQYDFNDAKFPFTLDAMALKDSLTLAYEAIKTLPDYAGAKDAV